MNKALGTASSFIGSAELNQTVVNAQFDIMTTRGKLAIESRNTDLIVEWLVVYSQESITELAQYKAQGKEVVTDKAIEVIKAKMGE